MRLVLTFIFIVAALTYLVGGDLFILNSKAQVVPTPGSAIYSYDSLGQIVQDVYPANSGAYSYDAAGNRITTTQN